MKKYGTTRSISGRTEGLYPELNESAATGDVLQYIYFVLVAKNHQRIRSKCLIHEFPSQILFNDVNHGYTATILKKNYLWLHPFYMTMATYCYYEKVYRTHCNCIVPPWLDAIHIEDSRSNVSMHPFSSPWKHQRVEKGCIENKWVNMSYENFVQKIWRLSWRRSQSYWKKLW